MSQLSPLLLELLGGSEACSRTPRIHRVNEALERAWRRGWAVRPSLDPDALMAKAQRRTGLVDFGPPEIWHRSLTILTTALRGQARLSPLGLTLAHGQLTALLANRLRLHHVWQRHPEIAALPVPAPIVIVGQMRSGTTRLQRLLACDPAFAHTRFFESWNPVPIAGMFGPIDDRRLRGRVALACARWLNPGFDSIHPTAAAQPDEEMGWQSISLFGSAFEAQWRVPDFTRHVEAVDAVPAYREFKHILQTVAWLRGERGERSWILKVPQFTQDLPAFLNVFPDARLLCLDRDPEALVASAASLVRNQMALQSDVIRPDWIGLEWLRKVRLRDDRMRAARMAASQPQLDLAFEAMSQDWRGEIERVYRFLGMPLLPAVTRRMARYIDKASRSRLAEHRYELADFGLTTAQVRAAMAKAPTKAAA